jgi:hypothetical protein
MISIAYIELGASAWALLQVFSKRHTILEQADCPPEALNFYGHAGRGEA